ncbi:hypothetical protein QN277_017465 [Acacia crassicarpa]|uniref:Uncharacterized protein n=1 Tax=Acacia crassicarpa TaxID=499986 RepID=A0AAE1JRA2_9FABA|nr:hypothetical protein QN277_017465 [Acacia crassicarpa]
MADVSDDATSICAHCGRAIRAANIALHYAHCSRNLEKCKICGDMIPKRNSDDHFLNTHAQVACSMCHKIMERDMIEIHKGESCPQRVVTCEFCEFPLPAVDLAEHQGVCGNRTELCQLCNRYVRLCERYNHGARCNGIPDNNVGSSRDARARERDEGAGRRPQNDYPKRNILFTVAVTGIAVLVGSILFQRKTEPSDLH